MILTAAAFYALAAACAPDLDPVMLYKQAQKESGLNTRARHDNPNKTTDYGLMEINSSNFSLLGVRSADELYDPCRNLHAAADLYKILSRYNSGRPLASIGYAVAILNSPAPDNAEPPGPPAPPLPPPCAPAWDAWATATCGHKIQAPAVALTEKEPMHAN